MFENFVIFTEVVKLSSNVFWKMKEVNYHDKLLDLIYLRKDIDTFEEVLDLVENKWLITQFIEILLYYKNDERWLRNIFKVIDYIDVTAFGNTLLLYSSRCGFCNFVKYLVEKPDCKVCQQQCCHVSDLHFDDDYALRFAAAYG